MSEDLFDPVLALRLQSIDDMVAYVDSIANAKQISVHSVEYGDELANTVRYRFYHGYSYYTPGSNWIAWLSGRLIWEHLYALVIPNHIMKHPMAACSQQAIVMMDCLKRKGIPYRSVQFEHHYAIEAWLNGKWRYFDPNMEPGLPYPRRKSLAEYIHRGDLPRMYAHKISSVVELKEALAFRRYGEVSAQPAPNATLFHRVTGFLSYTFWTIPFAWGVFLLRRRKDPSPAAVHLLNRSL